LRKLDTVIHKMSLIGLKCNEISLSLFYTIMSTTSIKLQKCKIANIINYQCWEQFCFHIYIYIYIYIYIVFGGCMVACRQHKAVKKNKNIRLLYSVLLPCDALCNGRGAQQESPYLAIYTASYSREPKTSVSLLID